MTDHALAAYWEEIQRLDKERVRLAARIVELEGAARRANDIHLKAWEDRISLRARIAELEGEIERLTAERNALRDHLADEVTRLNICIAELEDQFRNEQAEAVSLAVTVEDFRARIAELEGEVSWRAAQIDTLKAHGDRLCAEATFLTSRGLVNEEVGEPPAEPRALDVAMRRAEIAETGLATVYSVLGEHKAEIARLRAENERLKQKS